MMTRFCNKLAGDRRGVTVVEFAMVAPAMLLTVLGLGDLLYSICVQSILSGAVQKAGRDSTLQNGVALASRIDDAVRESVRDFAPTAQLSFSRTAYRTFLDMRPEDIIDRNANNRFDAGDCFIDRNGNGTRDLDVGQQGSGGGADDVVAYNVTVTFPRLFPMASLLGWSTEQQIVAQTLLKNQPFARQRASLTEQQVCI